METADLGFQKTEPISNKELREEFRLRFSELNKWKEEFTKDLATAHLNLQKLTDKFLKLAIELQQFIHTTNQNLQDLKQKIESQSEKERITHISRNLEKMNLKLNELIEEIGAGESFDVSKVPPNILELVYQSTLDDLLNEMWRTLGSHDAEKFVLHTLDEVRLGTSGSELFRFDGRRIKVKDVAKSIDQKLISAKQIQMTYNELIKHLTKYIPTYKIKNFRGVIRIKSQEYTVDKVASLIEKIGKLEVQMTQLSKGSNVNLEDLQNRITAIENKIQALIISEENDKSLKKPKEVKK